MLRENWIDFVCAMAIVAFVLVVAMVGCQRLSYEKHARQQGEVTPTKPIVIYGDGNASAIPSP